MQDIAYVDVNNEIVYVLCRRTKYGVSLKRRRPSKHDGVFLKDESVYLSDNLGLFSDLKLGKVIKL